MLAGTGEATFEFALPSGTGAVCAKKNAGMKIKENNKRERMIFALEIFAYIAAQRNCYQLEQDFSNFLTGFTRFTGFFGLKQVSPVNLVNPVKTTHLVGFCERPVQNKTFLLVTIFTDCDIPAQGTQETNT
jgi:hypothetical protein